MNAIMADRLPKRYGAFTAVDALNFDLEPGTFTGFVGVNGAGKSTTMRMLLGLSRPSSGRALIEGTPYAALSHPTRTRGALLDPNVFHPRRTGHSTLLLAAKGLVAAGFRALVCVVAIATSVAAGVVSSVIEDIPLGLAPTEEWVGLLVGLVAGALF